MEGEAETLGKSGEACRRRRGGEGDVGGPRLRLSLSRVVLEGSGSGGMGGSAWD